MAAVEDPTEHPLVKQVLKESDIALCEDHMEIYT